MDIIVTGVSGGMGLATAKQLIRDGHRIFGLDIKAPKDQYESLLFFQTDLRNEDAVKAAFHRIQEKTDQIGAIIHLAGIYDLNSLVEMSEEEFLRSYEVNLFSVYRVNKTFLPLLKKGSRILITTSELAPLSPLPFTGIYGITKTALDAYAVSLRRELMLLGILVIIIRPGAVDTGLLDVSTRRLEDFCDHTEHYSYNADRFRNIVAKVESRKITPERLSKLVEKALFASHPRLIYTINRNPLLLLMNILPAGLQDAALKWILLK
ncbi:MAG: SDR family NAD(P)-dependent oxidoreductase [Lachnospiraceae bacterium]|nr:SDR family NAD(P)-dependent oxidoreductase [Lachnospiraceae bacterium]MBR7076531.1 SDR family NAD(P)-dependent oxidoreductase [Lachnospiraceae bacterium]